MKTFRLAGLSIQRDGPFREIPFEDGLVINKENKGKHWLIEVFTGDDCHDFFKKALEEGQELRIKAAITRPDNPPAPFRMAVKSIRKVNRRISVLLEGHLQKRRPEEGKLEQLLDSLMKQGISEEELLRACQKIKAGQTAGQTKKEKRRRKTTGVHNNRRPGTHQG